MHYPATNYLLTYMNHNYSRLPFDLAEKSTWHCPSWNSVNFIGFFSITHSTLYWFHNGGIGSTFPLAQSSSYPCNISGIKITLPTIWFAQNFSKTVSSKKSGYANLFSVCRLSSRKVHIFILNIYYTFAAMQPLSQRKTSPSHVSSWRGIYTLLHPTTGWLTWITMIRLPPFDSIVKT